MPTTDLIKLLTWFSPGFPTGGYAYSHGLEWAVQQGDVMTEGALTGWLEGILRHGAGRSDAILVRQAYAANDIGGLIELTELATALSPAAERRAETLGQGGAFTLAASVWRSSLLSALATQIGPSAIPYPIAVGALARAHGMRVDEVVPACLHAFAANLVSAAVRLIPLGQTAGLRTLAALEQTIVDTAEASCGLGLDDLGGACFRADIAAMRHETQYTRLFRT